MSGGRGVLRKLRAATLGLLLGLTPRGATAQQLILKGEYGLMGGTTPPPGFYVGVFGGFSWSDQLTLADGTTLHSQGGVNQYAFAPLISWVSKAKILGANYNFQIAAPWANTQLDFPRLDQSTSTGTAFSQLWVVPVGLGWHLPKADVTFAYAFYPPTGRYTAGASNNTSLGMWCNEFSLRGTVFLDKDKAWNASLSTFYDINGKKEDLDWTTGNPLTLMYGVGRNYGKGKLLGWAGVVGYSQWQVTSTTGADAPLLVRASKTQINGVGPEITTLQGALTVRYFWQYGAKFSLKGTGLFVQFVLPL